MKCNAPRNYIFAAAIMSEVPVVKTLQTYFEQQANDRKGISTANGKFDAEALAAILSLPARVQMYVWKSLDKHCIGHSLRDDLKALTRLGVFLSMCCSIANGDINTTEEVKTGAVDSTRRDYNPWRTLRHGRDGLGLH